MTDENVTVDTLIRHQSYLEETIDPDSGLLDDLLRKRILTAKDIRNIKNESPYHNRNSRLLQYVIEQGKSDAFAASLRNTEQAHIVNYLLADGEYRSEFGTEWPLSKHQLSILDDNQGTLVDLIEMTDLLARLFSKSIINKRQRNYISSKQNPDENNEAFLEILRRRSQNDYKNTIECLRESKQFHIAQILDEGGVTVRVHLNTDETAETEMEIVNEIAWKLSNRSSDDCVRILKLAEAKLTAAKVGHSIILYIYCVSAVELHLLRKLIKSGEFKDSAEWLFNRLLNRSKKTNVTGIRLEKEKFARLKQFLDVEALIERRISSLSEEKDAQCLTISQTTIDHLPLELLDVVLQKYYLSRVLHKHPSYLCSDCEIFSQLAAVNNCWHQRLTRKKFRVCVHRKLIVFYGNQKKKHAVVRNISHYLQHSLHPPMHIRCLKSTDCITDVQAASLQRQRLKVSIGQLKDETRSGRDKNSYVPELLEIVKSFDKSRFLSFIHCLCRTVRKDISRVVDSGGVVVKVEVQTTGDTKSTISHMMDKFEKLKDEREAKSHPVNQLLVRLKEAGLEMLDAVLDRNFACWIWCRSQNGLENLQQVVELKSFSGVFSELVGTSGGLLKLSTDCENYKKTMVLSSVSANFTAKLDFGIFGQLVMGITKLRNKIYVLCLPAVIFIFEDRNRFRCQGEIEVDIEDMFDIGSCDEENCLYVTGSLRRYVWKITEERNEYRQRKHVILKWLETGEFKPSTLSVSSDGQLVMVSRWSSTLRIYGSDAQLRLSTQLPDDIKEPQHAVKTRCGNLIILHELGSEGKATPTSWAVSELSGDGKTLVRRFFPQNEGQRLNAPYYLLIDSSERVFVADERNNRVILLDSTLKWNQTLIPTEEENGRNNGAKIMQCPWRLFYDEETKHLFVGGFKKEGINVYTLTKKAALTS